MLAAASLLWLAGARAAGTDEAALRACLAANLPRAAMSERLQLTRHDSEGARTLDALWYWQRAAGGQDAMMRLSAPADLAGAAYLMLSRGSRQDFYLYVPALHKVRHVNGASAGQSLFGSGLSAFDLGFLLSDLRAGTFERVGPTRVGTRGATLWRYTPAPDPNVLYDRVDLAVDDAWCLPLRVGLFGGVPWKTLDVDAASVRHVGSRWLIGTATLTDLRDGSVTDLRLSGERLDAAFDPALFDPGRFFRAP